MRYRFFTCDVFTKQRFGGNQLAVLPEAEGLSTGQMQQIAREFNFSETTFVLPPEAGHTRRVRIFTPTAEMPFAGHPNIGTAFVLATDGAFGDIGDELTVIFEEDAGLVPVTIQRNDGDDIWCELTAPQGLTLGDEVSPERVSAALSLQAVDIATRNHPPRVASVGFPFIIVELQGLGALREARIDMAALDQLQAQGIPPDILLYTHGSDGCDIRARMFAPLEGVPEDPATGSANCALAALLSHYDPAGDGEYRWRIMQGVEMGRPSVLDARALKQNGVVENTWIGGDCVLVSEGSLLVD